MEFDENLMIPDPSLSINQGAIVVLGWQSCTDKGSFTRAILDALAKEYHLIWIPPLRHIPRKSMISCCTAPEGNEVKVRYKSQRGEGVYECAFEG